MTEKKDGKIDLKRADMLMDKLVMANRDRQSGKLSDILFDTLNYFIRRALRRILKVDDLQINDMLDDMMSKKGKG